MKRVILIVGLLLLPINKAHADVLCAPKTVKVKNGAVALASIIKVATKCPSNLVQLFDTEQLKGERGEAGPAGAQGLQGIPGAQGEVGPQGDPGLPALAHSTCQKRTQHFVNVVTNENRSNTFSKSCAAGEFAYAANVEATYSYSNDWTEDVGGGPSGFNAGTSGTFNNMGASENAGGTGGDLLRETPNVFDADGLFLVGYQASVGPYADFQAITGSLTFTFDVTLTCCLLGD
jgi:hypothetical protein